MSLPSPDHSRTRVARIWVALWLALIVAVLPGPQAPEAKARSTAQIVQIGHSLGAIHHRDLVGRPDAIKFRPMADPGPAAATVPPPLPRVSIADDRPDPGHWQRSTPQITARARAPPQPI